MRTFYKILLTFGILGVFVIVVALLLTFLMSGLDVPSFISGDVAVIPIHGAIVMGGCPGGLFSAGSCAIVDDIKKLLKDADDDPAIKAIVLDIYSGGGNVVASRELMRAIKDTDKPVVAWIGEVGASGAYYAASAADTIVADENSMTGSIGVIMFIEHYYGLMDKVGMNVTVLKAGKVKDIGSPYRPMTDKEQKYMQDLINKVYLSFLTDVAENRGLDLDYVKNISEGQIYLGVDAKDLGLVDELGGYDHAIDVAADLGGIEGEPNIRKPKKELGLLELLS